MMISKHMEIKDSKTRIWNLQDRASGLFALLIEDYNLSACEICDGDILLLETYAISFFK